MRNECDRFRAPSRRRCGPGRSIRTEFADQRNGDNPAKCEIIAIFSRFAPLRNGGHSSVLASRRKNGHFENWSAVAWTLAQAAVCNSQEVIGEFIQPSCGCDRGLHAVISRFESSRRHHHRRGMRPWSHQKHRWRRHLVRDPGERKQRDPVWPTEPAGHPLRSQTAFYYLVCPWRCRRNIWFLSNYRRRPDLDWHTTPELYSGVDSGIKFRS